MTLELNNLERAIQSLADAIAYMTKLPNNISEEIVRDSIIQRFEYSYELSWKLMQRWIKINLSPEHANPRTKKELFRIAATQGLIETPNEWFDFAEARNHSAHTYNETNAIYVYQMALKFLPAAEFLYQQLTKHND